jgi:hypothetical protein
MITNFLKKIIGLDKLEARLESAQELIKATEEQAKASLARAEEAKAAEEVAKMSPKDLATKKGEGWVGVLDTKVNPENPRNGFFELDWNDKFIVQLKEAGYGFDGDAEEEIVDRWFRDLARNMLSEDGLDPNRPAGFIDVKRITENKSEVS